METLLLCVLAYLLGSIPCGLLLARTRNIDIRQQGSGNIGATNVARILGKKAGVITLLGDMGKGCVTVLIADYWTQQLEIVAVAGLMAFLGHLYSVFLKFKGGKGVATGLGIFLYLMPIAALCTVAAFSIALWATGYVSIGSITATLLLPVFGWALGAPLPYIYCSMAIAVFVVYKHRDNIVRLKAGTEARFLRK
jgi:glycerol-3-phosphate acyltransferase PlsY